MTASESSHWLWRTDRAAPATLRHLVQSDLADRQVPSEGNVDMPNLADKR